MVRIAGKRGLPVSIYRPSIVGGHSETGIHNEADFTSTIVKACIQLGEAPLDNNVFDIVPVDFVAAAIVYLSTQRSSELRTFHLCNPNPYSTNMFVHCASQCGLDIHRVSFKQWLEDVRAMARDSANERLLSFLSLLGDQDYDESGNTKRTGLPIIGCRVTYEALAGSDIVCPSSDEMYISTYVSALAKVELNTNV